MVKPIDIVFATVPYTDTLAPLMAPAILKSIALKANKTSATIDLNIKTIRFIEQSPYKNEIINFFHHGASSPAIESLLYDMFYSFAQEILTYNPKIVGLSVFTYNCQIAAKYLSFVIKKLSPSTKIILGGAGLTQNLIGTSKYAEQLVKQGIIDFYIRGDGENALYSYLIEQDNIPGINSSDWQELTNEDLKKLPTPDYDDYNFNDYKNSKMVPMLGSRGCVRNCSFCDIHAHWTKFSWRSGEHIFEEMLELNSKYNVTKFMFQDSLINGNLKEYRVLMKLIAEYNRNQPDELKFEWSSFFILRPLTQFTEEDWRLTAEGGGLTLFVGIESFNDEARFHLGKKFTNEDIEFGLKMARKYGIKQMVLLFFVGYVTETEADIDFAIKWYEDHVDYRDMLVINLGTPLGILPGTPLQEQFDDLKLVRVGPFDQDWVNPETGNTPERRVEWFQRLETAVTKLGYGQVKGADNRFILERMMQGASASEFQ